MSKWTKPQHIISSQVVKQHKTEHRMFAFLAAITAILLTIGVSSLAYAKYATDDSVTDKINLTIKPAFADLSTEVNDITKGSISPAENVFAQIGTQITIDEDFVLHLITTEKQQYTITPSPAYSCYFDKWTIFDNGEEKQIGSDGITVVEGMTKVKAYFNQYEYMKLTNNSKTNEVVKIGIECTKDSSTTPHKPDLKISKNGIDWTAFVISFSDDTTKNTVDLEPGESLLLKGDNPAYYGAEWNIGWSTQYRRTYFTMSSDSGQACIEASGHILSLINDGDCADEQVLERTYCFQSMFKDCKELLTAKDLRMNRSSNGFATNLCSYIFYEMFEGCSNLVGAPELPTPAISKVSRQTGLDEGCYQMMFKDCVSLENPPALPTTKEEDMAEQCYRQMFEGCTALKEMPVLNALSLKKQVYYQMFARCSSITSAMLPATKTVSGCYGQIFNGCSSLKEIEVGFTSWKETGGEEGFTADWVKGVAANGTFVAPKTLLDESSTQATNRVPTGWISDPCNLHFDKNTEAEVTNMPDDIGPVSYRTELSLPKNRPHLTEEGTQTRFMYWYYIDSEGVEHQYKPLDKLQIFDDTTLLAKWGPAEYITLSADADPNDAGKVEPITISNAILYDTYYIDEDSKVLTICTQSGDIDIKPSMLKTEYKFDYWSATVDGKEVVIDNSTEVLPNTTTITAHFKIFAGLTLTNDKAATQDASIGITNMSASSRVSDLKYSTDGIVWHKVQANEDGIITTLKPGEKVFFRGDNSSGFSLAANEYASFVVTSGKVHASGDIMSLIDDGECLARSVTPYCFYRLFHGCDKLVGCPDLPATTLGAHCYENMFSGCSSLALAPQLNAENMTESCYQDMFNGCTSLETAPVLPSTSTATNCYKGMFNGCLALKSIVVDFTSWSTVSQEKNASDFTTDWVKGVPTDGGTFVCPDSLPKVYSDSGIPQEWKVNPINVEVTTSGNGVVSESSTFEFRADDTLNLDNTRRELSIKRGDEVVKTIKATPDSANIFDKWVLMDNGVEKTIGTGEGEASAFTSYSTKVTAVFKSYLGLIIKNSSSDNNASVSLSSTAASLPKMLYCTDGANWVSYTAGTVVTVEPQAELFVKGSNSGGWSTAEDATTSFVISGAPVEVFGSLLSLVDNGEATAKYMPCDYCFANLFKNCQTLTSATITGAQALKEYCYMAMFEGCSALITAPELQTEGVPFALQDGCFKQMFKGCTSLETAPSLDFTTLKSCCYQEMFSGCENLAAAPSIITSTGSSTCTSACNAMFKGCVALQNAPTLNITKTGTSICEEMFAGCELLESAPVVKATSLMASCYKNMFNGCVKLTLPSEFSLDATGLKESCYEGMFKDCKLLTTAPTISASALAVSCCKDMFSGCEKLESAPTLGSTTMKNYCYSGMFAGCTSLSGSPTLGSTSLATYCYENMFKGCISLSAAPALPGGTMKEGCYSGMFEGCTFSAAPILGAKTLAPSCYKYMFKDCSDLSAAPALGATTLQPSCYEGMFTGCTILASAPTLSSTKTAQDCYKQMFDGCSNLANIEVAFISWSDTSSSAAFTTGWVNGVATAGTFVCPDSLTRVSGSDGIPSGWVVSPIELTINSGAGGATDPVAGQKVNAQALDTLDISTVGQLVIKRDTSTITTISAKPNDGYVFDHWTIKDDGSEKTVGTGSGQISALTSNSTNITPYFKSYAGLAIKNTDSSNVASVSLTSTGTLANMQYCLDGCTWTNYTSGAIISVEKGKSVLLKGANAYGWSMFGNITSFAITNAEVETSGNLMSLIDDGKCETTSLVCAYGFANLFKDCKTLTKSSITLAQDCKDYCYSGMYSGCSGLIEAPAMQTEEKPTALATGCYAGMFKDCTSLETAPSLPFTTLQSYCYKEMFAGCSQLVNSPAITSNGTTTIEGSCYAMFKGCVALENPPAFNIKKTGASICEEMFAGCIKLKSPPVLEATTLNTECYKNMFNGCRALESAPSLGAKTMQDSCYSGMFEGCSALSLAPVLASTSLAKYCYENMFKSCTGLTSAPALLGGSLKEGCYLGMFEGCSFTTAPSLGAKTLANGCYKNMFKDCANLGAAPELGATTLQLSCYEGMFAGCTTLTSAPTLSSTKTAQDCYKQMFDGCSNLANIEVAFNSWSDTSSSAAFTTGWVNGVATAGTFVCPDTLTRVSGSDGIPSGWAVSPIELTINSGTGGATDPVAGQKVNAQALDTLDISTAGQLVIKRDTSTVTTIFAKPNDGYVFDHWTITVGGKEKTVGTGSSQVSALTSDSTNITPYFKSYPGLVLKNTDASNIASVSLTSTGALADMQYCLDGCTWTTYESGSVISVAAGKSVLLKGANSSGWSTENNITSFVITGSEVEASGNLMSLIDDGDCKKTSVPATYGFAYLFKDCATLKTPPELGATTLKSNSYLGMFEGCTTLTKTPVFQTKDDPLTLQTYCYKEMFKGCSSLSQVEPLTTTTMKTSCYEGMFRDCITLANAPKLDAEELAASCYKSMFQGCTGLSQAPLIAATTLATSCCESMFQGCTGLTKAPELKAETLKKTCYKNMFNGCTKLAEISVSFTGWGTTANDCTGGWVTGVKQTGIFNCPLTLDISYSESRIPLDEAHPWSVNPCALTFNANVPSGETIVEGTVPANQTLIAGKEYTLSTLKPEVVSKAKVFTNWSDGSGKTYAPGDAITITSDITLTANWETPGDVTLESEVSPSSVATITCSTTIKPKTYDKLSIGADTNKLIITSASGGTNVEYSLSDVTEGYMFDKWTIVMNDSTEKEIGSGEGQIDTLSTDCKKVKATFKSYAGLKLKNVSTTEDCTLKLSSTGTVAPLYYCADGIVWHTYSTGISLDKDGGFVILKAAQWSDKDNITSFVMTGGSIEASGNIMSLLDNGACTTKTCTAHCFNSLFSGCAVLAKAPELPATTLENM